MSANATATATRPVHEIKMGRVKAAIWANESKNGTLYNVTLKRIYKDGDEWKESTSFGRDDLLPLAKLADQAHSWVITQSSSRG